jgi:starvation-inducible DNA-binding protein
MNTKNTNTTVAANKPHRTDLQSAGVEEITAALRELLADVFALFVKTKNFHWHMSGRHFRDFHLMLDDHADQLFAMVDPMAERARKLGGVTLRSIGDIARHQRIQDNSGPAVSAEGTLKELLLSNQELLKYLRATHETCDRHRDVATASLLENWIDETEQRSWFLYEITQ